MYAVILGLFILTVGFKFLTKRTHKYLINRFTIMEDLPLLGMPRVTGQRLKGTAIICGGSISGLLTARICADHFEEVLIIEPEEWLLSQDGMKPDPLAYLQSKTIKNKRSRILQWRIIHGYYPTVTMLLSRIFPDLEKEVSSAGGSIIPWNAFIFRGGRALPWTPSSSMKTIPFSRESMEATLRRLVLKYPNIKQIQGRVVGVLGDHSRLTGVKVKTGTEETSISGVLVVDCTGLSQAGFNWLQDFFGAATSEAQTLSSLRKFYKIKYPCTSVYFRLTTSILKEMKTKGVPGIKDGAFHYIYLPNPHIDTRAIYFWLLEDNILTITLSAFEIPIEINDIKDVRDFMNSLKFEEPLADYMFTILDILEAHDVSFSKYSVRCPNPSYVMYSKAKNLPSNFIGVGDSVQSNSLIPSEGEQGTAKASADVITLNTLLSRLNGALPKNFGKTFFDLQAARTGQSWEQYKCDDYLHPSTVPVPEESKTVNGSWLRKYLEYYWAIAWEDPEAANTFFHAMCWTVPMTDLFAPRILVKMLGKILFGP